MKTVNKKLFKDTSTALGAAALTLALAVTAQTHAANNLPQIGSSGSRALSIQDEQEIGDHIMRQIRRYVSVIEDPVINDYVETMGFKLVAASDNAEGRRFHFFVVSDNTVNASAFPGGYIGLNSGLITSADSESEVASVLAHEVAHVTQRHLARRLELQQQLTVPSIAGLIGSLLLGAISPDLAIGGIYATQASAQQSLINHTRANEREADRIGISTLAATGYDPTAMADFFGKLQVATRYYRKAPEFLSTHPITRERIAEARNRSSLYAGRQYQQKQSFDLLKALLAFRIDENSPSRVMDNVELNYPDDSPGRYLQVLKQQKSNDFAEAIAGITELLANDPQNMFYLQTHADLSIALGRTGPAIARIEQALAQTPANDTLKIIKSKLLISADKPFAARELLLPLAYQDNVDPLVLKLLAEAQSNAGLDSETHETQGQYLFALGDLDGAQLQYELALGRRSDDPYARTRLSARIEQVEELRREQLASRRR